jgi:hypothetical protein
MRRILVLLAVAIMVTGRSAALRPGSGQPSKLEAARRAMNEESLEAEQIHVTLGRSNPLTYVISWVTLGPLPDEHASSIVLFTQVTVSPRLCNSMFNRPSPYSKF